MEAVLGASLGCFHGNCSIRQNGIYVVSSIFIVLTQRSSSPSVPAPGQTLLGMALLPAPGCLDHPSLSLFPPL